VNSTKTTIYKYFLGGVVILMTEITEHYFKRDFWAAENLKYVRPHFRLEKIARLINRIAPDDCCELLDVGCGPATLAKLLKKNINYYGIDIAIHIPAANLLQADFLAEPIQFENRQFDLIVAQGVFEYVGTFQHQKLIEIKGIMKHQGRLVLSYVNFDHIHKRLYEPYNNVLTFDEFRRSLTEMFHIERCFPTSHHWYHREPNRSWLKALQMRINVDLPLLSRLFGVEYLFICSIK